MGESMPMEDEGYWVPEAGITDTYELLDVGAGKLPSSPVSVS